MAKLDSKIPKGPLSDKWTNHKSKINLVSPANKRQIDVMSELDWQELLPRLLWRNWDTM
jgi:hypothetical protein